MSDAGWAASGRYALKAETLKAKQIGDAKQRELKQALDESEAKAEALARQLSSARVNIASVGKPLNEAVVAQHGALPTGPPNGPVEEADAAPGMPGVLPNRQGLDHVTAATPTFSDTRSAPISVIPFRNSWNICDQRRVRPPPTPVSSTSTRL